MTEILTIIAQRGEQTQYNNNQVIITSHLLKIFFQKLFTYHCKGSKRDRLRDRMDQSFITLVTMERATMLQATPT